MLPIAWGAVAVLAMAAVATAWAELATVAMIATITTPLHGEPPPTGGKSLQAPTPRPLGQAVLACAQ